MIYVVEITEVSKKQIRVGAESKEKAQEIAKEIYYSGEEILTIKDIKTEKFEVIKEGEE